MSKAKRKGRIFVDYLRNGRGATAIAPYSPRARGTAPIAVPVSWDELKTIPSASVFKLKDMQRAPGGARSVGGLRQERGADHQGGARQAGALSASVALRDIARAFVFEHGDLKLGVHE